MSDRAYITCWRGKFKDIEKSLSVSSIRNRHRCRYCIRYVGTCGSTAGNTETPKFRISFGILSSDFGARDLEKTIRQRKRKEIPGRQTQRRSVRCCLQIFYSSLGKRHSNASVLGSAEKLTVVHGASLSASRCRLSLGIGGIRLDIRILSQLEHCVKRKLKRDGTVWLLFRENSSVRFIVDVR